MKQEFTLEVNGAKRQVRAEPDKSLLFVLRDDLDNTGCKYGCGEGQCGACTVLLAGKPVRSCITAVSMAAGKPILTVEGLAKNGKLHPVQEAFIDADAMQCGYCIPGMILSAVSLLQKNPQPTDPQIVQAMQGNVCRCGTYPRITAAIKSASRKMRRAAK
jgi:aerobic-type carbon monoxide dehydrogenase small subunit (CoxS/CutS family)